MIEYRKTKKKYLCAPFTIADFRECTQYCVFEHQTHFVLSLLRKIDEHNRTWLQRTLRMEFRNMHNYMNTSNMKLWKKTLQGGHASRRGQLVQNARWPQGTVATVASASMQMVHTLVGRFDIELFSDFSAK